MNRNVLSLLILAGFLLLTACDGRISLQHTPTPKCIGDTWSYAENILTKIKIDPDLRITMVRLENAISEIRVGENGENLTTDPASITSKITVYGDGKVVREDKYNFYEKKPEQVIRKEKRIQNDQLQNIIGVLEAANFYAISYGCGGKGQACPCGHELDISVETKGKVHAIKDMGICYLVPFDRYCDLGGQINAIIGEFQENP